jgi:hypothetical protein
VRLIARTYDNLNDDYTAEATRELSTRNSFDYLLSARWHQGNMFVEGDFEIAGFDVDIREAGNE